MAEERSDPGKNAQGECDPPGLESDQDHEAGRDLEDRRRPSRHLWNRQAQAGEVCRCTGDGDQLVISCNDEDHRQKYAPKRLRQVSHGSLSQCPRFRIARSGGRHNRRRLAANMLVMPLAGPARRYIVGRISRPGRLNRRSQAR
jgi:hypothetical protein